MRFLDVFSGIGGFRLGLEQAGMKCIGHIEKDKYANQSYKAIHRPKESEVEYGDITTITDAEFRELRGKFDILVGGFPCQAFSIAGDRRGFEDTRGTLFFELARILEQSKPPLFLFENVKGLLNHDQGQTFEIILKTLDELGYDVEWQVLNSKDFGVPQSRERVFIVGHSRDGRRGEIFPIRGIYEKNSKLQTQYTNTITARYAAAISVGSYIAESKSQKINAIPIITPERKTKRQNCRIRRLTPKECWRLQGFPDWAFDRAKASGVSESQLYKQAGNAVTVNVICEIGKRIMELL